MSIEDYKQIIISLVESSKDLDYIIAVYSFAEAYPDKSKVKNHQSVVLGY